MEKTVEELQEEILKLQDKIKEQDDTITTLNSDIENYKTNEEDLNKKIQETREINSKLALRVSTQVFTPPQEDDEPEEDKVMSLDELAKHF